MSEKDLLGSPQPAAEPPTIQQGRIRFIHIIKSDDPLHFEPVLKAYAQVDVTSGVKAREMNTDFILDAAIKLGGVVETIEVGNRPLPEELTEKFRRSKGQPIRIANGVLSRRPNLEELIYAAPRSSSPAVAVEEIFSPPPATPINPPYPSEWKIIEGGVVSTEKAPDSKHDIELANNIYLKKPAA